MQIRYFKDLCEPCLNAPEVKVRLFFLLGLVSATVLHFSLSQEGLTRSPTGYFGRRSSVKKEALRENFQADNVPLYHNRLPCRCFSLLWPFAMAHLKLYKSDNF